MINEGDLGVLDFIVSNKKVELEKMPLLFQHKVQHNVKKEKELQIFIQYMVIIIFFLIDNLEILFVIKGKLKNKLQLRKYRYRITFR